MVVRYLNMIESNDLKIQNDSNEKLVKFHELFIIGSINKNKIIYVPLMGRLYFLSQKTFNDLKNGNETEELIRSNLLVPQKTEKNIKDGIFSLIEQTDYINILLTNDCNLRCKYCYANGGEKKEVIDFNFVKCAIDHFIDPKKSMNIIFQGGGEPTLQVNLIKKILKYAKTKSGKINPMVQTNGTLSENALKWFLKNNFEISLSSDGPPEIQNKQRPKKNGKKTSKSVEKTMKLLIKNKCNPNVRVTITKSSVKRQLQILEYLKDFGMKKIIFQPVTLAGRALKEKSIYNQPPALDTFIENLLKTVEISEEYGIKIKSRYFPFYFRSASFCGNPNICLSTDGFLTACNEVVSGKKGPEIFVYGRYNINSNCINIEKSKMDYFKRRNLDNLPSCKNCFARWGCAGGCYIVTFRETGDIFKPNSNMCKKIRKYMKKYLFYKVKKHFIRIKPYISEENGKLYYSMFFNEFKLNYTKNNRKLKENPILNIDVGHCDFKKIINNIVKYKKLERNKPIIFLLSFSFESENLNLSDGRKITKLFNNLNGKKIWFKVISPLPSCIFGNEYNELVKSYNLPVSCKECLKMFVVKKDKSLIFCTGLKACKKINEYADRNEIFEEFKKNNNTQFLKKCTHCINKIRGNCKGICYR